MSAYCPKFQVGFRRRQGISWRLVLWGNPCSGSRLRRFWIILFSPAWMNLSCPLFLILLRLRLILSMVVIFFRMRMIRPLVHFVQKTMHILVHIMLLLLLRLLLLVWLLAWLSVALRSLEKGFNLLGMLLITGFIYFVWSFSFLGNDVCVIGKKFEISPWLWVFLIVIN